MFSGKFSKTEADKNQISDDWELRACGCHVFIYILGHGAAR